MEMVSIAHSIASLLPLFVFSDLCVYVIGGSNEEPYVFEADKNIPIHSSKFFFFVVEISIDNK